MADLYTKLYVRTTVSHAQLLNMVASIARGTVDAWTVVGRGLEIDVRPNEDAVGTEPSSEPSEAFLHSPFTVEVVSDAGPAGLRRYLSEVGALMTGLHKAGMQVVANCDWEDKLPGKGRLEES
jgi:hypothetical protein